MLLSRGGEAAVRLIANQVIDEGPLLRWPFHPLYDFSPNAGARAVDGG